MAFFENTLLKKIKVKVFDFAQKSIEEIASHILDLEYEEKLEQLNLLKEHCIIKHKEIEEEIKNIKAKIIQLEHPEHDISLYYNPLKEAYVKILIYINASLEKLEKVRPIKLRSFISGEEYNLDKFANNVMKEITQKFNDLNKITDKINYSKTLKKHFNYEIDKLKNTSNISHNEMIADESDKLNNNKSNASNGNKNKEIIEVYNQIINYIDDFIKREQAIFKQKKDKKEQKEVLNYNDGIIYWGEKIQRIPDIFILLQEENLISKDLAQKVLVVFIIQYFRRKNGDEFKVHTVNNAFNRSKSRFISPSYKPDGKIIKHRDLNFDFEYWKNQIYDILVENYSDKLILNKRYDD